MTLNEYQTLAQRTSRKDMTPGEHLMNGILGLTGEAGECSDLVKKHFYQDGRGIYTDLLDEVGDTLWYIAEIASAMEWKLDDIADHNIKKLMKRYPEGFDVDRSLHREVG